MKLIDFLIIFSILAIALCIFLPLFHITFNQLDKSISECTEYKNKPYRWIDGGFFGDPQKVITTKQNADGYMQVCVKGLNWKGEVVIP